jgi:hypothetical protein
MWYVLQCLLLIILLLHPLAMQSQIAMQSQKSDTLVMPCSACAHTDIALERSQKILQRLVLSVKRDTASIDSLVRITRTAHDSALVGKRHLTAMMLLATSQAAQKLTSAENVLMFRLKVRDVQLFLTEARRYWLEKQ